MRRVLREGILLQLLCSVLASIFFILGAAHAAAPTPRQFIEGIYVAYWGRAADPEGLGYWQGSYDAGTLDYAGVAENFANSPEGISAYAYFDTVFNHPGDAITDTMRGDFVTAIYQNLFNRAPDAAGLAYWKGILTSGATSPGAFIANIINSAYAGREGASANDWNNINAKIQIAEYYTNQIVAAGITWTVAGNLQQAGDVLAGVDKDSDIAAAKLAVDQEISDINPLPTHQTGNQEFDLQSAIANDPLFGFRGETPSSTLLPASIDYTAKMPIVKSQGSTSSCTSWATGYYYKTYHELIEEGWDQNQNTFSPMYLYSLQCRNYSQPWSFIAAWETLNQYGCAKYATMPFVDLTGSDEKADYKNVTISSAATSEARNFRCGEKIQLEGVSQVKQALTESPVLFGINNYSNLHLSSSWHPSPENNYITYDGSNSNVGHAILCVGYDDSKFGTGAFKFINSWGQDWAIDGFSWLRYSDYNNIVLFSMRIQDIPNANQPDNTTSSPAAPSDVTATDDAGPYVDITWSTVSGAQYYRIYRATVDDSSTYSEIGTAYQGNYRDYPEAGVTFYYSVVSYNDVGSSAHYASDTDAAGYVDKGSAKGSSMSQPALSWLSNDDANIRSNFAVSNLAADTSAMEVLVAASSAGPWHSFGWASPGNFYISWGQDSEYIGKKPFVKIVASSSSGTSASSSAVQVAQTIVSSLNVAAITSLQTAAMSNGLQLTWSTNGGGADYFEIWRWLAAEDDGNEWIFIDIVDAATAAYTDTTALPGKNYYYAVGAVYRGVYGEFAITENPASLVTTQANLFLYETFYDAGQIVNPANFLLTVWNDGGVAIADYSILIYVLDLYDGELYYPFDTVYASDYSNAILQPGYSHTLNISLDLPWDWDYANGHYYLWIIEIDSDYEISELYEDDNWTVTEDVWWADYLYPPTRISSETADSFSSMAATGTGMSSSRPFSKKRVENLLKGATKGATLKKLGVGNQEGDSIPIQFKKPSFCVDHGK
ncbi:MAG: DUF4214 domain-containing protein [Pseudomonadota bacterium]